jgi:adenylate cyclase class 2
MEIPNPDVLTKIFHGLELRAWFRYEKMRTTFRFPGTQRWAKGLLIEVDETPIGNFLELEGPASAIDRAAAALGFHKNDYVLANYMVLYREYCERRGDQPRDMLFANKKRAPRS